MTEKQFFASKWKPFEIMRIFIKDLGCECECMLIGIDFEEKIMKLRPCDPEIWEDGIYEIPINITERGKIKKMHII
jgi:hypothetical protein